MDWLPFRIHSGPALLFATGTILFQLAALYFGGVFIRIALFWDILYLLDILILILNTSGLRYSQDFSSCHGTKGEQLSYDLKLTAPRYTPVPFVLIRFSRIHARGEAVPPENFSLYPGESKEISQRVHTSLKGVYTMGMEELEVRGFTGILSIKLPIWSRTFYIYPRLIKTELPPERHRSTGGREKALTGSRGDYHSFSGLRKYRESEAIHRISWKRFMQTGEPYIRGFDSRGSSTIAVCLDRRPSGRTPECEDTVLEAALAVIYGIQASGGRALIYGFKGWDGCEISTFEEFDRLYKSTLYLEFDQPVLTDIKGVPDQKTLYLVSGMGDLALLTSRYWAGRNSAHLIAVTENMSSGDRKKAEILMDILSSSDLEITEIQSSERLKEELSCLSSS